MLAHPKKLRVIAESTRKTDKIDAEVLAVFLALDMIPESHRPSPRIRQYRVLARHRRWLSRRITSVKTKLRNKLAHYNADIAALFTRRGMRYMAELAVSSCDRFEMEALQVQLELFERQLHEVSVELEKFSETAPLHERESRDILASIPLVGPVTIDVVLSELGDWTRFSNTRKVVDFAGLSPGRSRERRSAARVVDHQGGLASVALGLDSGGLASGGQVGLVGIGCISD